MAGLAERLTTTPPPEPVYRGLVRVRRALRLLHDALLPADGVMVERTFAALEVRTMGVAVRLGLPAELAAGPRTSEQVAASLGLDSDRTDRLLRLLEATGVARQRHGRWRLTRLGRALDPAHGRSAADWVRFFGGAEFFRLSAELESAVAGDGPATDVLHGTDFFSWLTDRPDVAGDFDAAMANGSRLTGPMIAANVDWSESRTVCDVGGGTGRVLTEVLRAHPHLAGILFDQPSVVSTAEPFPAGVAGRMVARGGDFFDEVPAADTMLLVAVLHDWGDDEAARILDSCATAMNEGGRVLVVDNVLDADRPPFLEYHADVLMMLLTRGGRERTVEDIARLAQPAGLTVRRTWSLLNLRAVELVA
jgi:SAM-dependent methyltransferase